MIYLFFSPLQLAATLFLMASRGQCENIEIEDKQVGGWAFLTQKEKSNQCQKSHRMFKKERSLETI